MNQQEYEREVQGFVRNKTYCKNTIHQCKRMLDDCWDFEERTLIKIRMANLEKSFHQLDQDLYKLRVNNAYSLVGTQENQIREQQTAVHPPNLPIL